MRMRTRNRSFVVSSSMTNAVANSPLLEITVGEMVGVQPPQRLHGDVEGAAADVAEPFGQRHDSPHVVGRRGNDARLLRTAQWLAKTIGKGSGKQAAQADAGKSGKGRKRK